MRALTPRSISWACTASAQANAILRASTGSSPPAHAHSSIRRRRCVAGSRAKNSSARRAPPERSAERGAKRTVVSVGPLGTANGGSTGAAAPVCTDVARSASAGAGGGGGDGGGAGSAFVIACVGGRVGGRVTGKAGGALLGFGGSTAATLSRSGRSPASGGIARALLVRTPTAPRAIVLSDRRAPSGGGSPISADAIVVGAVAVGAAVCGAAV